eukprot:m.29990 g.29990  ORF g.29990 m.29990 type:complete len:316 (-) comp11996_c0_seq5:66-1013(-)
MILSKLKTLAKQSEKLSKEESPDTEAVDEIFQVLEGAELSVEQLEKSNIGKAVNMLRKTCSDKKLASRGKALVRRWADLANGKKPSPTKASSSSGVVVTDSKHFKPHTCDYVKAKVYDEQASLPKRNKHGELIFEDYPDFRPNLTPDEVFARGAFGGSYYRSIDSRVTGKKYTHAWKEFPAEWFQGLDVKQQVARSSQDTSISKYGVSCGSDKDFWENKGWMSELDPYGWFQWYCRFFLGRRSSDDDRQVGRGKRCFSETGRWRIQLCNKIMRSNKKFNDRSVSPVIRQTLLHWGYELTERDYAKHVKKNSVTQK